MCTRAKPLPGRRQPAMNEQQIEAKPSETREFITADFCIVWKDLRIERHTRQTVSVMVMFSVVTVIMFNFALEANLDAARNVSTGLLWATILLAGTLGLNRSLALERENQTMDALLIAPVPRNAIYLGKVISITLFTLVLEAIFGAVIYDFLQQTDVAAGGAAHFVLGTVGYIAAGVIVDFHDHPDPRQRGAAACVATAPLSAPGTAGLDGGGGVYVPASPGVGRGTKRRLSCHNL
ncbi:MAG: heme exporter protein CcmB [Chloroflexi bacterium]|nr:heme exporter protein CcmB [Chloroflexota bacterium]